jgi:signal transduction histidine kinase
LTRLRSGFAAWITCGLTVGLLVPTLALAALTPVNKLPEELRPGPAWFLTPVYLLVLAATGALIASRRANNFIGWLMCAAAALGALVGLGHSYSLLSLANGHPGLIGVEWLAWLASWGKVPWLMLQVVYLPMLFPEGRPFKHWAWLLWAASLTALVGVVGEALDPDLLAALRLRNPLGIPDPHGYLALVGEAAELMLIGIAIAALGSVFIRLRAATGDRRQQLKWVGAALALLVTTLAAEAVADVVFDDATSPWLDALVDLAYLTVPVSVAFAVLRYRLYDIDLVINRTLVYGTLMIIISAVYLLAVVGVGAVLGLGNSLNLMLSLLATATVALAFEPARQRVQRLANQLVYGRRATPYDALAALSRRVVDTVPSEVLLSDMARAACDAIGVRSASFWLRADRELSLVASWPPDSAHETPDLSLSHRRGWRSLPVQHQGRLLGAISVALPSGRSLSASDHRLLADVANQAGLVLSNLGLAADLMARVAELRDSRHRLVNAQDEERRRIERNLHDGAQQHLFGLKVNIRHIRTLLQRDPVAAKTALEQLEEDAEEALQEVRQLAHGVYPPLLTAQGLAGALRARARTCSVDVRVSTDGIGRYAADLEGAVYFCCTEALQNAVMHAEPSTIWIRIAQEGTELAFEVEDDGRGFDIAAPQSGAGLQGMRDRVDVVGGTLDIVSELNKGTAVRGRVSVSAQSERVIEAAV